MRSYLDLLEKVIVYGEPHEDRTGVGTRSTFGMQWQHNMRYGFPLLTTKQIPFRWVAEELFWFLSGSCDERELSAKGVDIWQEWATEEQCAKFGRPPGDLGPVYGRLWRSFPAVAEVDQIAYVVNEIVNNPNSRRIICTGWHPYYQDKVALPPCHTLWQIKCGSHDRLSLHLYARSIDIFLGLPFNIASYGLLLELLAYATGKKAYNLIFSFGDLHIYNNHLTQATAQLFREPREAPRLTISAKGDSPLEKVLNCQWGDLSLSGYSPHPKIPAPIAV